MTTTRRPADARSGGGRAVLLLTLLVGLLGACAPAAESPAPAPSPSPSSTAAPRYYVSIGDSYAAGYQPTGKEAGGTSTNGFAYQVADRGIDEQGPLQLVNFGCSGTTSSAAVNEDGCASAALGPRAPDYADRPQGEAAVQFIRANPGSIALVTVVLGGNDLQPCLFEQDPQACVEGRLPQTRDNLDGLLAAVRDAAGPTVPVVGLTYPDPYLAASLKSDDASKLLAQRSVTLFKDYLNPTLSKVYRSRAATFVDITAASGAYDSSQERVDVDPYGPIPAPVASACRLTFYCRWGDVHPTNAGYRLIADQVVEAVHP